jgi:hypothetical protein
MNVNMNDKYYNFKILMDFNYFIFPTPESSYSAEEFNQEIIYIPRGTQNTKIDPTLPIPCLYLPYS